LDDSSWEELELFDRILTNNVNVKHLDSAIHRLQQLFSEQESKLDKTKYSKLLLVRRAIVLGYEKSSKLMLLTPEELVAEFPITDDNESIL